MQLKNLAEISFPHTVFIETKSASGESSIVEIEDTIHDLQFIRDERGFAKFRSRKSGKHYFQAPGMIWYAEGE